MKIMAVSNQKGGVGKTTIARHLSFHAGEQGLRTLVVDLDPQGDLTRSILQSTPGDLRQPSPFASAHLLFQSDVELTPQHLTDKLALIAGTKHLIDVLTWPLAAVDQARDSLARLAPEYDICIIDTPPTMSNLLCAGIVCSNFLVMPCDLDEDATEGLLDLTQQAQVLKENFNPDLELVGVLLNKVNRRRAYDQAQRISLRNQWGNAVLDVELQERVATKLSKKAPVWRNPRGDSDRRAAKEMRAACRHVFNRIGL